MLYQPQGSIWSGSASIGFSEIDPASGTCRAPNSLTERFQWTNECNLLDGECNGSLSFSALVQPLRYGLNWHGGRISSGGITLPVNVLELLGSPWSSLHPRGEMQLIWSELTIDNLNDAGSAGNIQIKIHDLSSAISPVKPLGSYEIAIALLKKGGAWDVQTVSGPLFIKGKGELDQQQLHFSGEVSASPDAEDSLVGLMSLLGKRSGNRYLIRF